MRQLETKSPRLRPKDNNILLLTQAGIVWKLLNTSNAYDLGEIQISHRHRGSKMQVE